jgi:Holliday junction resolvasome RuvABC DNA-binding subunit
MLTRLIGTIGPPDGNRTCVDVRGVGYAVTFSDFDRTAIAARGYGGRIACLVRHVIKEESEQLFGFFIAEEANDSDAHLAREVFDAVVKAKGVGPGVAMKLLSAHRPGSARIILSKRIDKTKAEEALIKAVGKITGVKLIGLMP